MDPLADIPGLQPLAHRAPGIAEFVPGPDVDAAAVVAAIRERWSLSVFDGAYPSVSDPGAYVTLYRRGGTLRAQAANHGWSSGWADVSDRDAASYLALCLADVRGAARLGLRTTDRLDWPGDGRSAERFRQYVAGRLADEEPDDV